MERTLVLSAFAVGWLGWLFGMLGTLSGRGRAAPVRAALPRLSLWACVLTPLFVFLATLPTHAPFAAGQGFGRGFAFGAIGALLAGWLLFRADADGERAADNLQAAAVATGPFFLGAAVVAMPILWMHMVPTDALLGVAIGWFVNSFLLAITQPATGTARGARTAALTVGVGFTATLAIAVALGDYRGEVRFGSAPLPVSWRAVVLAYGASIPFVMLLCALPATWISGILARLPFSGLAIRLGGKAMQSDAARRTLARTWRLLPGSVLLLCVARLFSSRLDHHPPLFALTGIGLLSCFVAWWLTDRVEATAEATTDDAGAGRQNRALAIIMVMCGTMAAYQMFAGVGIGIVLLAAWLIAGLALHGSRVSGVQDPGDRIASTLSPGTVWLPALLNFGLIVEIYRFVLVRFGQDLRGVALSDHYALFGFVIGAVLPVMLAGYLLKRNPERQLSQGELVGRALVAGALTLCAPFVLVLLFGAKCILALCFGLAVGAILPMLQAAANGGSDREGEAGGQDAIVALLPSLMAVAAGLALAQWTHHVTPMALYARAEKLRLIEYLVVALIAMLLASDYFGRYRDWRSRRIGEGSQEDTRRAAQ